MDQEQKSLVCAVCRKPFCLGQLNTLRKIEGVGLVFVHKDCLNAPLPEQQEEKEDNLAQE